MWPFLLIHLKIIDLLLIIVNTNIKIICLISSFFMIYFRYLFRCPYSSLICTMNTWILNIVTVFTYKPYLLLYRFTKCQEMFSFSANFRKRIRSQTINIFMPACKINILNFYFFFEFKFDQKLRNFFNKILFW